MHGAPYLRIAERNALALIELLDRMSAASSPEGLINRLRKRLIERVAGAELEQHLADRRPLPLSVTGLGGGLTPR